MCNNFFCQQDRAHCRFDEGSPMCSRILLTNDAKQVLGCFSVDFCFNLFSVHSSIKTSKCLNVFLREYSKVLYFLTLHCGDRVLVQEYFGIKFKEAREKNCRSLSEELAEQRYET